MKHKLLLAMTAALVMRSAGVAQDVPHDTAKVAKETGHATTTAAKDTGHAGDVAGKKTVKATAHNGKKAVHVVKKLCVFGQRISPAFGAVAHPKRAVKSGGSSIDG
jgi:hypothetical protein